ncbi:GH92 family glycosyl hydrolase [Pseudoxanthomonas sp. X-1]|uniref:GH92 family glycosyl hydrolase n=1 Tax=Pseudoxanthomonas sp. X-1 TaxID=2571115 RepID=UPI00110A9694|nr:GH92 family glycosyl hydrolase [Pseudoxanthomonas sp. X-1]TMN24018.1 glycoside hydrolase family 92 protein [Pseudoxanthomonas sp. X-1]UAY75592.1 GH92 family glycosyl hydrolase [Pseudoxanthomonas sp. X-1]
MDHPTRAPLPAAASNARDRALPRHGRRAACVALLLALPVTGTLARAAGDDLAAQVNTFIGTRDEGNTFPGAAAPFGMIQVSPIGSHYAGWRDGDERIRGFGHSFISGAGCWEQGGQVSVLPVTGRIGPGGDFDTSKHDVFDQTKYGARYTQAGSTGQAGDYRVRLTDYGGIEVETTALTRASGERYTYPAAAGEGHVLINVGQANQKHRVIGSQVHVVGDRVVEGKITTLSFCGGHQYATWFRIEYDRPFKAFGVWGQAGGTPGARDSMESEYEPLNGAWVSFDTSKNKQVTAITSISHVDAEGARVNLRADGMQSGKLRAFEPMRRDARALWQQALSKVRIDGGSKDDRAVFYTALYHALLQPMTGNDADGRYRGYDDAIHEAKDWTYYEFFSLWDTYRSQNQLLSLIEPQRARDIGRSLLAIDAQGGWLPRWGYANFDTNTMTGDPVTPFLVDLWRYGALKGLEPQAWAALRKNAWGVPPLASRHEGRAGNVNYLQNGFVFFDRTFPAKGMDVDPQNGGSATLEYALGDCALSLMAGALGHGDDAAALRTRGGNWHKVWDADLHEQASGYQGFPRPRLADGQWFTPPTGTYDPRSHYGFHEGTAWQYQWLVPQDIPGLATAMGGREAMGKRLDDFFAYDQLVADPQGAARKAWVGGPYSYYGQYRYNPNNEPTMHVPALYSLIGQPWKTATVLSSVQTLFTNAPNGVTGNDDLGTMSAFYLFSTLGFSPLMPGTGQMLLHPPRFTRARIDLGNGRTLTVRGNAAPQAGPRYVQGVRFNGKPQSAVWMDVDTLRQGGTLDYTLGTQPDPQGWGTAADAAPAASCPV